GTLLDLPPTEPFAEAGPLVVEAEEQHESDECHRAARGEGQRPVEDPSPVAGGSPDRRPEGHQAENKRPDKNDLGQASRIESRDSREQDTHPREGSLGVELLDAPRVMTQETEEETEEQQQDEALRPSRWVRGRAERCRRHDGAARP